MGHRERGRAILLLVRNLRSLNFTANFLRYYPIGLYNDAAYSDAVQERGALVFLFVLAFLVFSSTFAHMVIAGIETAETAGNLANLLFSFALLFNGVLVPPQAMPGFWIFMYRVSPFTYMVEGLLSTSVAGAPVTCAANEYLKFQAPAGINCGQYLAEYIAEAGGYLQDPTSSSCSYCQISNTNAYLAGVSIHQSNAWRDFGLMFAYILFNIAAAPAIYYLARVPKGSKKRREGGAGAGPIEKVPTRASTKPPTEGTTAPATEAKPTVTAAKPATDPEKATTVEAPATANDEAATHTSRPSSPQVVRTITPVQERPEPESGPLSRPELEYMVTAREGLPK